MKDNIRKIKKIKIKWKNIILLFLLLICVAFFVGSTINIVKWFVDNKKTDAQVGNIDISTELTESEGEKVISNEEKIDKFDPYWDFIKMKLISVDFNQLKQTNSDVVGWIKVNGTNVNYPFVQTKNNTYYLNHSFDKTSNGGGWVFLDYRNNIKELNKNTIIYAHGRKNNTLFGSLKKILSDNWYENKDNYVIKLSTETENTLWQIFSIYKIPNTSDYLQIDFSDDESYLLFLNELINRSKYDFKTSIDSSNNILTLSTCYDDNNKIVMHAKLIKREIR